MIQCKYLILRLLDRFHQVVIFFLLHNTSNIYLTVYFKISCLILGISTPDIKRSLQPYLRLTLKYFARRYHDSKYNLMLYICKLFINSYLDAGFLNLCQITEKDTILKPTEMFRNLCCDKNL